MAYILALPPIQVTYIQSGCEVNSPKLSLRNFLDRSIIDGVVVKREQSPLEIFQF